MPSTRYVPKSETNVDNLTADELVAAVRETPGLAEALLEEHGIAITLDGKIVKVAKEPLKKRVKESVEEGKNRAKHRTVVTGFKIKEGTGKTGQAVTYAVYDGPIETAKGLKQKTRNRKAEASKNHARRVREREARKQANKQAKELKSAEKDVKKLHKKEEKSGSTVA